MYELPLKASIPPKIGEYAHFDSNIIKQDMAKYLIDRTRDVFVYKVHINPDTGAVIGMDQGTKKGGAYLLFKGIGQVIDNQS